MQSTKLPPHRLVRCIPEKREPGMTLFNVRPGGWADLTGSFGWIVGVSRNGDFVINWEFDQQPQDTCVLANGNILFSLPKGASCGKPRWRVTWFDPGTCRVSRRDRCRKSEVFRCKSRSFTTA